MILAKIAANTTTNPLCNLNGSTISFVIVPATPVNVKAPIKFIIAAKNIAVLGVNARVDTLCSNRVGRIMESIDKVKD